MTNKKSFTNLQQWLTEVNEFASADVPKLLIGKINYCLILWIYTKHRPKTKKKTLHEKLYQDQDQQILIRNAVN